MNVNSFIQEAKRIQSSDSVYAFGFTGQKLTSDLIRSKAKQYPGWYSQDRIKNLEAKIGINAYDCSGLIKAICKNLNISFPDINADMIFKLYCNPQAIPSAGCLIHKDGHIGICIDSEYVIEASSAAGKVIISKRLEKNWKEFGYFNILDSGFPESSGDLLSDLKELIKKYEGRK